MDNKKKNIISSNNKEYMEDIGNKKVRCVKCDKEMLRTSWSNHIKTRGHLEEPKRFESAQHERWRNNAAAKRERLINEIGIDEVRRLERERKQRNRNDEKNKKAEENKEEDKPYKPVITKNDFVIESKPVKSSSSKDEDEEEIKENKNNLPRPEIKKQALKLKEDYDDEIRNISNSKKLVDKLYQINSFSIIPGKEQKQIKKSTLTNYLKRINTLYMKIDTEYEFFDFKWLDDYTKIEKFIYSNFTSSTNNYFIAIYSILGRLGNRYEKTAEKYRDLMTQSNIEQGEKRGENLLNEKEKSNWVDWTNLKNYNDESWTDEAKLLHALYTDIPPRRNLDYALLKLARKKSVPEAMKLSKDFNYIVTNKKGNNPIAIILNRYKTADKYGTYVINLIEPDSLPYFKYSRIKKITKLLIENEDMKNGDFIFSNSKGESYGKDFGKNFINNIFKNTGKNISVNVLRHSFITYLLSKINLSTISDNTLKKISLALGHTPAMLLSYRKINVEDALNNFKNEEEQ